MARKLEKKTSVVATVEFHGKRRMVKGKEPTFFLLLLNQQSGYRILHKLMRWQWSSLWTV
jgi:hypothetical protein